MESFLQDVRFAVRGLRKDPGFTIVALLTLALGIGANSAIFTVVNAVVLRPLPFPEPERLVRVTADFAALGTTDIGMSAPELFDYRDRADIFESIAGLYPINANLTQVDQPERVEVMLVSPTYFSLLGAQPALGRVFGPEDDHPGIAEVAVISDALWKRRFGGAPDVLGRTLRIDDDSYAIVGVMPPAFRHPGMSLRTDVELWAPAGYSANPFGPPARGAYFLSGSIARLKPGISVADAQQRLNAFGQKLRQEFPNDYPARTSWTPRLVPLQDDLVGNVRPVLLFLLGAVGLVLAIACANIAGLLLARASARQRELAMRRALGSGRSRIIRLLLTESVLLALAGGVLGLWLAALGVDVLLAMVPAGLPRTAEVHVSGSVVAFSFAAAVLTGVLFGLAPAIQFSSPNVLNTLKDGQSRGSSSRRGIRPLLVAAEFALAMVLLVGAALLVRSFWRLQQVEPGFESQNVLTARVWLPRPNDPARGKYLSHPPRLALFDEVLRRVRELPGVDKAAIVMNLPLDGQRGFAPLTIDGRDPADTVPTAQPNFASHDYFDVMRIPVVSGRAFNAEDTTRGAPVARDQPDDGEAIFRRQRSDRPPGPIWWSVVDGTLDHDRRRRGRRAQRAPRARAAADAVPADDATDESHAGARGPIGRRSGTPVRRSVESRPRSRCRPPHVCHPDHAGDRNGGDRLQALFDAAPRRIRPARAPACGNRHLRHDDVPGQPAYAGNRHPRCARRDAALGAPPDRRLRADAGGRRGAGGHRGRARRHAAHARHAVRRQPDGSGDLHRDHQHAGGDGRHRSIQTRTPRSARRPDAGSPR